MLPGGQSTTEEMSRASAPLLRALTEVQADVIRNGAVRDAFDRLLAVVLELTGSKSGVIGEVQRVPGAPPSLRVLASIPRDEADASWELPVQRGAPGQEPGDLRTLVGAVFTSSGPVLSGGAGTGPTWLGLPLESGGERVGLVGLAHRPGGYDAELIDFLQPFLLACSSLLVGWRNEQRRRQAEEELRRTQAASAERLQLLMDSVQDGVWDMDMLTGRLFVNRRWLGMLGYDEDELEHSHATWARLCHPDDAAETERLVGEHLE
ncbi:MAG: PAS domain-containing protein, partial [Archangium sp.]